MRSKVSQPTDSIYRKVLHFLTEDLWHIDLGDLSNTRRMLLNLLQFLAISVRSFLRDRGLMTASALTFSTLLALIPVLVLVFTFFSLLGGANWLDSHIRPLIFDLLATGSGEKLSQSLSDFVRNARLGTWGTMGFIFMIVTCLSLLNTIESAFNRVWSIAVSRTLLQKLRDYWSTMTIAPILIILSLFLTTSLEKIPLVATVLAYSWVNHLLTMVMPFILQWVAFYLFFLMIPNTMVRSTSAALGALVGSVLWEIAKAGYLTYTANAVKYNLIYGSIAFLPIFMIWMYLTWVAILIGVEVSYVHQNFASLRRQRQKIRLSFAQIEQMGLMVMVDVARRFMGGNTPTTVYKLSHRMRLPAEHIRSVVTLLRNQRLLGEGDDDYPLTVMQDLDRITVQSVLDALRTGGGTNLIMEDDTLYSAVGLQLSSWRNNSWKLMGNMTLRQLVREIDTQ